MTRHLRRPLVRSLFVAQLTALALTALVAEGPAARSSGTPTAATTPIQHVVIVLKENRSFDEYFGQFPNLVNGPTDYGTTTAKRSDGTTVPLAQTKDPTSEVDHSPFAFNLACDLDKTVNPPRCRNDGFNLEKGAYDPKTGDPIALSQMSESQIPSYWAYAQKYGLAAQFFASWKGASFANNLFEVAGQAGQYDTGTSCVDNAASPGTTACHTNGATVWALPSRTGGGTLNTWGCDDPADTQVNMSTWPKTGTSFLRGTKTPMFPCFLFQSLPDALVQNNLTWGFYVDSDGRARRHNGLDAISSIRNTSQWANVKTIADFTTAAQNGRLPNVSWVLGKQTEHLPLTACAGENQTVSYVNAVMNGSDWDSSAIFVVWDEWGGFYDHIPPPQLSDRVQYGFRVPFLAISPYTKVGPSTNNDGTISGGSISFTPYSHASMLRFVLDNWGLPANSLTPAVAGASDLMDMFDFQGTPKGALIRSVRNCTALSPAQRRVYHRNPWD